MDKPQIVRDRVTGKLFRVKPLVQGPSPFPKQLGAKFVLGKVTPKSKIA